jgi:hypothetical protein
MVPVTDACFQVIKSGLSPTLLHHFTDDWHLDAQKPITFAVLSLPRLEETGEIDRLIRILARHDFTIQFATHSRLNYRIVRSRHKFRKFFLKATHLTRFSLSLHPEK